MTLYHIHNQLIVVHSVFLILIVHFVIETITPLKPSDSVSGI